MHMDLNFSLLRKMKPSSWLTGVGQPSKDPLHKAAPVSILAFYIQECGWTCGARRTSLSYDLWLS